LIHTFQWLNWLRSASVVEKVSKIIWRACRESLPKEVQKRGNPGIEEPASRVKCPDGDVGARYVTPMYKPAFLNVAADE